MNATSSMGSCCAKDDATPNNPKSTFFGDQDNESILYRSLFPQVDNLLGVDNVGVDNVGVDNLDRRHSL